MLQGLQSPPECSPSWDSSIASATVHPFTETLIEIRRMKVKEEQQQRKESVSRIETKSLPPVRGGGAQLVRPLVLRRYSSEGEHRAATSLGSLVTPSFRAAPCHHLCPLRAPCWAQVSAGGALKKERGSGTSLSRAEGSRGKVSLLSANPAPQTIRRDRGSV